MYLDEASVKSTLVFVAKHSTPGSAIIFDFMCQPPAQLKWDLVILFVSFLRRFFKEERVFQVEASQIEPFLVGCGFHQVRMITASELQARYFTGRNAARKITSDYAIAIGVV